MALARIIVQGTEKRQGTRAEAQCDAQRDCAGRLEWRWPTRAMAVVAGARTSGRAQVAHGRAVS